jgi:hypothetical protein
MKHILQFNSYDPVEAFLFDQISEDVFFNYLDSLNEGLVDFLKSLKQKVIDVFWTILTKSVIIGFKILEKVKSIFSWFINKIKSLKEKNPTLFKVLVITILVILILIISGNVAHAATTGQPIEDYYINLAIGLVNDMKETGHLDGYTQIDVSKATAYLIKLRDAGGIINTGDANLFGNEALTLAHKSIELSEKLIQDSHHSEPTFNYCMEMLEKGEKFIGYELQKLSTGEKVKLFSK